VRADRRLFDSKVQAAAQEPETSPQVMPELTGAAPELPRVPRILGSMRPKALLAMGVGLLGVVIAVLTLLPDKTPATVSVAGRSDTGTHEGSDDHFRRERVDRNLVARNGPGDF
jgi:hypothetical protein